PLALRFVARRQQHERRMISVSLDHAISFVVKHSLHRRAGTDLIPHSRFRLQVETELIGGFKRSFGRSPRMKTHVVQPPTLARLKQFSPVLDFCVWITSQGKVTAAVSAAKVDRLAVED